MLPGFDTKVVSDVSDIPVRVEPRAGLDKVRRVYRICGFGGTLIWGIHNNSLVNLLRGLKERVFRVEAVVDGVKRLIPPPRPIVGAYDRMAGFIAGLKRHLPKAVPIDREKFPEYYRGRRKGLYAKAAESLQRTPVSRGDARVKTFVKAEKINLTAKPDPAPRVIQPRDPRYNVEVGRFLRPIEKLVYRAIAKMWGGLTVLKVNSKEQASALWDMWCSFKRPVAVGLDAKRFDQHVSVDALRWEHALYVSCFRGADKTELARLLEWQLHNRGVGYTARGKVTYETEGCRMSGDINTSLGNCLIMCGLVYTYCQERGIKARLANNGDDCVVIMEQEDLGRFSDGLAQWFLDFGFQMEVEAAVDVFEQIEFCQTHPVHTPDGPVMIRSLDVAVSKDLVNLHDLGIGFASFAGALGEAGLSLNSGIPVFQEFYQQLKVVGKPSGLAGAPEMRGGLYYLTKGMEGSYTTIAPGTRVSFALAFGILPDEQVALEHWLRANPLPTILPMMLTTSSPCVWYK